MRIKHAHRGFYVGTSAEVMAELLADAAEAASESERLHLGEQVAYLFWDTGRITQEQAIRVYTALGLPVNGAE